ncbi:ABC transporter permease [Nocardioides luteus]|uniref:ABC transporter permease n=1 Tax=Nocardioides luteus TaxID=1844 RepID=A0A1J4N9I9_9ACTN|nr:ABC transporter permease [Nocardioides luteus]OIJ28158.1 ABC transporter permease [Nocardioides luteus]
MNALINSTSAELLRLRKWSATWVVVGAWMALALAFGYVFNYVAYVSGEENFTSDGGTRAGLLAQMLPPALPDILVQGLPMFGGALAMVIGALAAGNGFGWGTWKTVFTQGPSRLATVGGSLLAVTLIVVAMITATLVLYLGVSSLIAVTEGHEIAMPSLEAVAKAYGTGFLVLEMWAVLGFLVGVIAKGPSIAVGLGLVWALVVENLLRGVGGLISAVETFTHVLPGTAGGSLVGALVGDQSGTPGVVTTIGGEQALITVAAYVLVAVVAAVVLMRRRDLA